MQVDLAKRPSSYNWAIIFVGRCYWKWKERKLKLMVGCLLDGEERSKQEKERAMVSFRKGMN